MELKAYELWIWLFSVKFWLIFFFFFPLFHKKNHSTGKIEPRYPRPVRFYEHVMWCYFIFFSLSLVITSLTARSISHTALQSPSYPGPAAPTPCRGASSRPESFLYRLSQREEKKRGTLWASTLTQSYRKIMTYTLIIFWYDVIDP